MLMDKNSAMTMALGQVMDAVQPVRLKLDTFVTTNHLEQALVCKLVGRMVSRARRSVMTTMVSQEMAAVPLSSHYSCPST